MPAEILKGIPRNSKAQIPPMAESGIAVNINSACETEPKVKKSRIKIKANASGTAIIKRALAALRFSN